MMDGHMIVQERFPGDGPIAVEALLLRLERAPALPPFDPALVGLCGALSAAILQHPQARHRPELVALAYWLRPAELRRLGRVFQALEGPEALLVPRGLAFHLPPGNVDTISVYSWALSLLVGNRNLVRLSGRSSPTAELLVALLRQVLAQAPATLREGNAAVSYGHDLAISAAISARAEVRMIWGGDATVLALRALPLPPRGVDLAFPDRWSWAMIGTEAWQALDAAGRRTLAEALANDLSWFDQQACASPRLLAWVGPDGPACGRALFLLLDEVLRQRGWTPDLGTRLEKLEAVYLAALEPELGGVQGPHGPLTLLEVDTLAGVRRDRPGGGLLQQVCVSSLDALQGLVQPKDQTVTSFGIDLSALRAFARGLNGRGVDRFVPLGQALRFDHVWDGQDLLSSLTRRVSLRSGR